MACALKANNEWASGAYISGYDVTEYVIAYPEGVAGFSRLVFSFPRYRVVSDSVQVAPDR